MRTAFDLDGVVIRDPFGLTRSWIIGTFLNYWFFFTWLGKFYYRFRQPDKRVKSWIENRKKRGEKIIIISGTSQEHRLLVEKWLDLHKIPYDELWLKEREKEIARFKVEILKERKCRFYLEDDQEMAQKIALLAKGRVRKWQNFYLVKLKEGAKS